MSFETKKNVLNGTVVSNLKYRRFYWIISFKMKKLKEREIVFYQRMLGAPWIYRISNEGTFSQKQK